MAQPLQQHCEPQREAGDGHARALAGFGAIARDRWERLNCARRCRRESNYGLAQTPAARMASPASFTQLRRGRSDAAAPRRRRDAGPAAPSRKRPQTSAGSRSAAAHGSTVGRSATAICSSRRSPPAGSCATTISQARDGWLPTARGGVLAPIGSGFSLRSAAYLGWRMPTLNELFRPFRAGLDATAANPELDPERLAGAEAGLEFERGPLRLSLTGFVNRLERRDRQRHARTRGRGRFPQSASSPRAELTASGRTWMP